MLLTETVNRVVDKEVFVQTINGDVVTVRIDRDETLASFKKRLQNVLTIPLDKSHIEFGNISISLSDMGDLHSAEDELNSPQMHAAGGLREFPHGAHLLLKPELRHRRSLSSPNLSLSLENASEMLLHTAGSLNSMGSLDTSQASADTEVEGWRADGEQQQQAPAGRKPSIQFLGNTSNRSKLRKMRQEINSGFEADVEPQVVSDGLGGCYILRNDSGKNIAIIKPTDEEPLAPNNPKGFVGRSLGDPGLKPTVRVGEAALRETAAYLLDYDRFARVPWTSLAKVTHEVFHYNQASDLVASAKEHNTKLVSLQEYVVHQYEASDVGTAMFPVDAVHRIGILDIRLFNTDRHSGNILVCKRKDQQQQTSIPKNASTGALSGYPSNQEGFKLPSVDLVPIDHGFCLPETLETAYFEWLHWPQASMAFNDEELEYISKLDPRADIALIQRELPMLRMQCLRTLEVSTMLLKLCAQGGLTLSEIGAVMSKPLTELVDDAPSELERLCVLAKEEIVFGASINLRKLHLEECNQQEQSDGEDSDLDEDHMFEMDDISSPTKASRQQTHQQFFDGEPTNQSDCSGTPLSSNCSSPMSPLTAGYCEDPGCIAQSPHIQIQRRYSTLEMGEKDSGPWMAAAASVYHSSHMKRYASSSKNVTKKGQIPGKSSACKPLKCDMPSSELKTLFSGMDSETWNKFLSILGEQIEVALRDESWKHSSNDHGTKKALFGTSCPKF